MLNYLKYLTVLLVIIMYSCKEIPEKYPCDNTKDPECEGYVAPAAKISDIISYGEIIDTNTITLSWSGNLQNSTFSYRLSNTQQWSGWSGAQSVVYNCLSDGEYYFYVQEAYPNGHIQAGSTATYFVIDYINKASIVLDEQCIHAEVNDEVLINIMLEEIEGIENVVGVYLFLTFDRHKTELVSCIELTSVLSKSIDNMVFISSELVDANNSGILEINMARLGGETGTGNSNKIAELKFKAIAIGEAQVILHKNSELRDFNNHTIEVSKLVNTTINIQ